MMTTQSFSSQEYEEFRRFLKDSCGITLGDNKQYLVTSRLGRMMQEMGIASLGELVSRLKKDSKGALHNRIIDAMTTNETYWFRDGYPYEILKNRILPEISERRRDRLRIWSTACSSGQEPYSISMIIEEYQDGQAGRQSGGVEIVATDISTPMLNLARKGAYDEIALSRGLAAARKHKYFVEAGAQWQVKEAIRQRVKFYELNLLDNYSSLGRFDVIYCRNVLIYFSHEVKRDILAKMAKAMRPGGYLIMGVSESPLNYSSAFSIVRYEEGLVYRLSDGD